MPMTLAYATLMRDAYYEAERVIVEGTAQSYRIGNRELTRLDLEDIRRGQTYYDRQVDILEGRISGRNVRMVVPRDL